MSVTSSANDAVFEIADDGIGIAPEAIPHIFERFYRADPSRANRADGVGLGLSLVHWAVDQHHGSIDVQSTPGSGTRFVVKIPLQTRGMDRAYSAGQREH
jgi:two-component system OmpR family sensor kinase